jgi:hypothetical protein
VRGSRPSQSLVLLQPFGGFIVELAHDGCEITVECRIEVWVVVIFTVLLPSKLRFNRRASFGIS